MFKYYFINKKLNKHNRGKELSDRYIYNKLSR